MPLTPSRLLIGKARGIHSATAMGEGSEPRILEGSHAIRGQGLADVILIGERAKTEAALAHHGQAVGEEGLSIHDPADSELSAGFAIHKPRRHAPRGMS